MNLFDFTLRLKGFPIKEARERLREIQQIPEEKYKNYVATSRDAIFQYHLAQNPFYKKFVGDANISTWEDIPVLRKKDLQIPLKKRLSNGFSFKNVHKGSTSGSSGTPLHYGKDRFCHALTWAGIIDRFGWYGIDFNTSYQARFYGIPLEFTAYQKERLKDRLSHRYRFPIFDLSEEKLKKFLNVFRRKKFDYINGHTSSIVLFAKFLERKGIVLTEACPTLQCCIVTSEMLFPNDKVLLEKQLGVPIINEYGASELDLLAFTNNAGEFQINSESIFLEIVDEYGNGVELGQPGTILVTMLYNKAHPFIRYEVGDIGVLNEQSTFKKPILKNLLGRANDNALLPNGKTVPGHTFYYVVKSALAEDSSVQEFIIEQLTLSKFSITYVSGEEMTKDEMKKLETSLQTYLNSEVSLTYHRVNVLDRSERGKLKQFVSRL